MEVLLKGKGESREAIKIPFNSPDKKILVAWGTRTLYQDL